MKARKPDSREVYRRRKAVRTIFTGVTNPVVGVSDEVALANSLSSKAAREAMREWKRTLSRGQRRKLRAA